jgi:LmbE family N-acetylglucosaminyl deacetylase
MPCHDLQPSLQQVTAQVFVPDGLPVRDALARTTHMAIGAHQDDLEIMAIEGILACFGRTDRWFTGVVVTDGRGSPRAGLYERYSDEEMRQVRIREQKKAAVLGEYAAQVLLDHPSATVKDGRNRAPVTDIAYLLSVARPEVVYTHNLADKHDTHVGVTLRVIEAIRSLPRDTHPQRLYGCEVWRSLDWLLDTDKIAFDCSAMDGLQMALLATFDSQVSGGKRYDLATMGRRRANATYHASHETDVSTGMHYGLDLTPLIEDPSLDPISYLERYLRRFGEDVCARLRRLG